MTLEDVVDPLTAEVIVPFNTELEEDLVFKIEEAGIEEIVIRSVLTCQTRRGVCAKCYGRDLARGYKVNIGEAIGIIASQSIGGYNYRREDILLDHEYVDVISDIDGIVHLDLGRFHDAVPLAEPVA